MDRRQICVALLALLLVGCTGHLPLKYHAAPSRLAAAAPVAGEAPSAPPDGAGVRANQALEAPVTLSAAAAPLRQVFAQISSAAHINVVFDNEVWLEQKVTLQLTGVSVGQALHDVLSAHALEFRFLDADTILVYPNTAAARAQYQETLVKTFVLEHAAASTVAAKLKEMLKPHTLAVDERLNLLIMRDGEDRVRQAERLIATLDAPLAELELEVQLIEVQRQLISALGIHWPEQVSVGTLASDSGKRLTLGDLRHGAQHQIRFGSFSLNAQSQPGSFAVMAEHRLRVRDGEKATLRIGEKIPIISAVSGRDAVRGESVSYQDVGFKLDVEPMHIGRQDFALRLSFEASSVNGDLRTRSGNLIPVLESQAVSTVLRLQDGQDQLIAGLLQHRRNEQANLLPTIGKVPLLQLFGGNRGRSTERRELLVAVTPRLIRPPATADAAQIAYAGGAGDSWRVRPASSLPRRPLPASPGMETSRVIPTGEREFDFPAQPHPLPVPPSAVTSLQWLAPEKVNVGDSFTVALRVLPGEAIDSFQLALQFDPQVLEVLGVTEGDFLRQDGAATQFDSNVDTDGQLMVLGRRSAGSERGASDAGVLLSLQVRAKVPSAASKLQLLMVGPAATGSTPLAATVPAPHTLQVRAAVP